MFQVKRGQGRFPPRAGARKARSRPPPEDSTQAGASATTTGANASTAPGQTEDSPFYEDDVDPMDASRRVLVPAVPPMGLPGPASHGLAPALAPEEDEELQGEDYEGNDIFQGDEPAPRARRQSSVPSVRLAGILRAKPSRSNSVVAPRGSISEAPVPIAVPVERAKRRKRAPSASTGAAGAGAGASTNTGNVSGASAIIIDTAAPTTDPAPESGTSATGPGPEDSTSPTAATGASAMFVSASASPEPEAAATLEVTLALAVPATLPPPAQTIVSRDELYAQNKKVVYAIAPIVKRPKRARPAGATPASGTNSGTSGPASGTTGTMLQRFRTGPLVEADLVRYSLSDRAADLIPLAPPSVSMTITSIDQLPPNSQRIPHHFLYDIEINPEQMSMKDLCRMNLPVGRVSDEIERVFDAKRREQEAREVRRAARVRARVEGESYEKALEVVEAEASKAKAAKEKAAASANGAGAGTNSEESRANSDENGPNGPTGSKEEDSGAIGEASGAGAGASAGASTTGTTPVANAPAVAPGTLQLQLSGNNIQLDQESTVRHQPGPTTDRLGVTETNPYERPVISNTYSKRRQTDKWTPDEETKFFQALSDWGTDFSIISDMFPHRTRKQVKAKFNNEEKRRPGLVELALARQLTPDLAEYTPKNETLKTMEQFEQRRAELKEDAERQKREIIRGQEAATKEDQERNRWKEIERKSGQKQPVEKLGKNRLRVNEEVIGTI